MTEEKAPSNEFKIGYKSRPKEVITQCEKLLKDEKVKDVRLSAVSNSIGELVITVEILKSIFPNLQQQNIFTTIAPRSIEKEKPQEKEAKPQKLFPRLEIILSNGKEEEKKENIPSITEEERKILIETLDNKKDAFTKMRKMRKFRKPFRNNRGWGYNGRRRRYAYSANKNGYNNRRRVGFNYRRPFGRTVNDGKKNNFRRYNPAWRNNGNKKIVNKNEKN